MVEGCQLQVGFANDDNVIYEECRHITFCASDGDYSIQSVHLTGSTWDHPYVYFTDMDTGNKSVRCSLIYRVMYLDD